MSGDRGQLTASWGNARRRSTGVGSGVLREQEQQVRELLELLDFTRISERAKRANVKAVKGSDCQTLSCICSAEWDTEQGEG